MESPPTCRLTQSWNLSVNLVQMPPLTTVPCLPIRQVQNISQHLLLPIPSTTYRNCRAQIKESTLPHPTSGKLTEYLLLIHVRLGEAQVDLTSTNAEAFVKHSTATTDPTPQPDNNKVTLDRKVLTVFSLTFGCLLQRDSSPLNIGMHTSSTILRPKESLIKLSKRTTSTLDTMIQTTTLLPKIRSLLLLLLLWCLLRIINCSSPVFPLAPLPVHILKKVMLAIQLSIDRLS